ncbi:MAG: ArsR/SmtB family transcription factor [Erysipelotrichaceae bacterium]
MNEILLVQFKALADANRLRIVTILKEQSMCACDVLERCECGQATLSHHMKVLVDAGLVIASKHGKWVHYALDQEAFAALQAFLSLGEILACENPACK